MFAKDCSDRGDMRLDAIEPLGEGSPGEPGAYAMPMLELGERDPDCVYEVSETRDEVEDPSGRCHPPAGAVMTSGTTN